MPLPTFGAVSTIVGVSGSAGGVNGDISVNYVSGITAGDLLVALVYSTDAAGGSVSISDSGGGWTAGPQLGSGGLAQVAMFYRTATGSESGTAGFSANWGAGTAAARIVGQIARYSGVDTSGVPYEASGTNNGSSAAAAPASITSTAPNRLAICLMGIARGTDGTIGAISGATGGTWSESAAEQAAGGTGTVGRMLSFQQADLASAGTLSGGSATISASSAWRNLTMALIGLPDTLPAQPVIVPSYAVIRSSNY